MRWLKYFGLGIVLLLAFGTVFQAIASSRMLHHPPGKLVDVGGYRMHLNCTGQGPAVVLDAGMGDSWLSWRSVQPQISDFAKVCSYDRAGMGWSDASPKDRTSKTIAAELHTLLHNAGENGPYILVGHSIGGINIRAFADQFRNEVAGMVFVDSSHPEQQQRLPAEMKQYESKVLWLMAAIEYTTPLGIPRMIGGCPQGARVECSFQAMQELSAEYAVLPQSLAQVRGTGPFGDLPLRVLSRDPEIKDALLPPEVSARANATWTDLQKEIAALSTNSKRVVAPGCGHYVHQCKPELVIEAVRELVNAR
jgi:pimeloyl-ACP methyl ester carboxylesterase